MNGLPEAAVEDLAIFSDGGLRLLRAAIAARGVWELRLDVADVQDLTYVRAHDDDLRHRARAVEQKRDLVTDALVARQPRRAAARARRCGAGGAVDAAVAQASPRRSTPSSCARFQAALRSSTGDPRVAANGAWDTYFSEVLRDLGAPLACRRRRRCPR